MKRKGILVRIGDPILVTACEIERHCNREGIVSGFMAGSKPSIPLVDFGGGDLCVPQAVRFLPRAAAETPGGDSDGR